ncbi:SGNH/GDSL hydrolase family protein [Aeromicrobium phragmitis]|uniref:SGNH/GDSL hydrolase family protein n=1 Tax=Aeromicrobium phragmitis TaxID=2478914 RepID=A0A3L8PLL5_9ACTN|nr:SGNH/GDSL hydrolase family protein [Aeromicrobium phragmitis]RLV55709.1 SGNH/GDSL hydrolase family protein [Aeromicrobium phragmitis]
MPPLPKSTAKAAAGAVAAISGTYGLLMGEVLLARRRIGTTDEVPPVADGVYGVDFPGTPVKVLVLGDSTAVGYGMKRADQTPPALIGLGLSHLFDAPVDVRSVAKVGARSSHLAEQIESAIDHAPDLVFILVGANDVTHQVSPGRASRFLSEAIGRLRAEGAEVVVGTCPDLGTVKQLPQPLRAVARLLSRQMARAQTVASVKAGARVVSLADLLGPLFVSKGEALFGEDRFHPSAMGYATMVSFLNAAAAAAWRERAHQAYAGAPRDYMTVGEAALEAAEHGGTQVVPDGRWASVLRRRR